MPSVEPRSRRSICRTLVFVTLRSFLVSTSSVVKKLAFIAVAAAILIGCDTAPGLVEPVNRLPNVSALEVTPGLVDLDEDPSYLERSEERRVGKECRCRWSPNEEIKNYMSG